MGEYTDTVTDLAVQIPGRELRVTRRFFDGRWHFDHIDEDFNLQFDSDYYYIGDKRVTETVNGQVVSVSESPIYGYDGYIYKDGVRYQRVSSIKPEVETTAGEDQTYDVFNTPGMAFAFKNEAWIYVTEDGYRWENKNGDWSEHDAEGRILRSGNKNGISLISLFDENSRMTGIADKNNIQVLWFEYDGSGNLGSVRDGANHDTARVVNYTYNTGNRLTTVTDVLGQDTVYTYNSAGRLIRKEEPGGFIRNIAYHTYGFAGITDEARKYLVKSVTDDDGIGKSFEYEYDKATKEYYTAIHYPGGKVKEVWYNKDSEKIRTDINGETVEKLIIDGRTKTTVDRNANRTVRRYDEWDNLISETYPDGAVKSYEYDHSTSLHLMTRKVDERGVVTQYEYDAKGNRTSVIEAAGTPDERVTEYTYDGAGNVLTIKKVGDANTAEAVITMSYDAYGNMETLIDPESHAQTFTYDDMGNVLTREDSNEKVWTYTYDGKGQRLTGKDPLTNTTTMEYGPGGLVEKTIDAEQHETRFAYDPQLEKLVATTDALDGVSTLEYDTDGNLVKRTDPENKSIQYYYDSEGRLSKTVDGNGNEVRMEYAGDTGSGCSSCSGSAPTDQPIRIIYPTFTREFTYDKRGRKIEERDKLSDTVTYVTQFAYDPAGNLIGKTDREGRITTYEYDSLNRLIKTIDPLDGETLFTYDDRDNLLSLTDAEGNVTRFTYDKNNRLLTETRPGTQETTYTYDANGRLASKVDPKNQKIGYEYDDAGRMIYTRYYADAADTTPIKTVTLTYDKLGNLKTYDDTETSGSYDYDALRRKTSETVDYGPFTLSQQYDHFANGLKKSYTGPDSITYSYSYDSNNQLAAIEIPGQGFVTISEYTWNRPAAITLPGGISKSYTYDPLMRLTGITATAPDQSVIMDYRYSYDKMDNITTKQTGHGDYNYTYDELYQLTEAANPTLDDEAYTYDKVGNRLTATDVMNEWVYNTNNEMQDGDDVSFTYDENGNTISKLLSGNLVHTYGYDVDNRMTSVEDDQGAAVATYGYDPFGRRLWKDVGGVKTYFFYSDEGLAGEYDGAGVEIKTYSYLPDSTWSTDPLFMKMSITYYWYLNDHLGTPQMIVNNNGAAVWSAVYDAFGGANIDVELLENNLRFPGQYFDIESGLHYNWHRYYDPKIGRYLRIDPIELLGGFNLYQYVDANPINYSDSKGLRTKGWVPPNLNPPRITPTPDSGILDYPYKPRTPGEPSYCKPCEPAFHRGVYWNCVGKLVLDYAPEFTIAFVGMTLPSGITQVGGFLGSIALANYIGYYCRNTATFCD